LGSVQCLKFCDVVYPHEKVQRQSNALLSGPAVSGTCISSLPVRKQSEWTTFPLETHVLRSHIGMSSAVSVFSATQAGTENRGTDEDSVSFVVAGPGRVQWMKAKRVITGSAVNPWGVGRYWNGKSAKLRTPFPVKWFSSGQVAVGCAT